jgi:hypothetical protein
MDEMGIELGTETANTPPNFRAWKELSRVTALRGRRLADEAM